MRTASLAGLLMALVLAVPSSASAAPYAPIPTCSPAPADCSSWHRSDVAISWQFEAGWTEINCSSAPVLVDGAVPRTCSVKYGPDNEYSRTVTVRRDATPPQVTAASAARAADSGGWYNRPVSVGFSGTDAMSGIASCTTPSYAGGDSAAAAVSGTCTDVAGNTSAPSSFALKYDATPPTVSVAADRAPDKKGWYRRPVTIAFSGADPVSGVASCTEATRYAGPDRQDAAVAGTCRDAAGNVAPEQKLVLRYDATAPTVSSARARVQRGVAHVTWRRPADAAIEIERRPGVNGRAASIVYQGQGQAFVDRTVKAGTVYRYAIRATDAAGNVGSLEVSTGQTQAQPLQRPAAGATVRGPVVLGWAAVQGARFYNVQLYRGGKKILSAWPKAASLRLATTWRFAGKRQRLVPGLYRWYVWAARGTRERPTYGRALGSSTFRVVR